MIYRDNYGKDKLSVLGFGCMRFPKKGNGFDMEEIEREIVYAVENGINYFDTAYIYPGSEEALGQVLSKRGLRDKINIASKMPHYLAKTMEELDKRFNEQLCRLKTDHIDYYLMHMLPDVKTWEALKERGILEWIKEKKSSGSIRRIGFSYHGSSEKFIELLHAYEWDFAQIQYNYMDEHSQAGRAGLMEAASMQIPVIIMEPLRGGRLSNNLPKDAKKAFDAASPNRSYAEWAFRWLFDQQQVSVVLSGMNSMDMLKENVRIASETKPASLSKAEMAVYEKVRDAINARMKVKCTGCSYCMPCPMGVDIPGSFRCLNVSYTDNYIVGMKEYVLCTAMKKETSMASQCAKCGKCEAHCPQGIHIRDELVNVKKRFENPLFKIARIFISHISK